MKTYVVLIRGINVGGKNKVPMAALKKCLEELGFSNVSTYIASGNVILESDKRADEIKAQIEAALPAFVTEHGHRVRAGSIVVGREESTGGRTHAEHLEVSSRYDTGITLVRLATADEGQ